MIESFAGPILLLLIIIWGFSFMLRPLIPARSQRGGGSGIAGQFIHSIIFSILLPIVWWTIGLLGRLYHRSFTVFTEFVTGTADWPSLRTSSYKYGGAIFCFIGFNAFIFTALLLISLSAAGPHPTTLQVSAAPATAVVCLFLGRMLMRRAP